MQTAESVQVSKPKTKNVVVKESEKEPKDGEEALDEDPEEDPDEKEELDEDPEEAPEEELDEESYEYLTSSSIDSKEPENDRKEKLNDETKSSLKSVTSSLSCVNNDVAKPIVDQNLISFEVNAFIPYAVSNAPETQDPGGSSGRKRPSRWCPVQETKTGQSDETSKKRKTRWDDSPSLGTFKPPDFTFALEHEMDPKVSLRMQLMEVNSKLQSSEIHDDRPAEERSPSPKPEYNNLGMRINTREARFMKKLTAKQKQIISKLAKTGLNFRTPAKLVEKIYIPVKENPNYNFVGLIIGPRGNTQKKMEQETRAKIRLRGKGSSMNKKPDPSDDEDLHVLVEADNQQSLDAAVGMVKKLLVPVADGMNNHKREQLLELAKLRGTAVAELRGTCEDKNICNLCKEQGHQQYACPRRESTFKAMVCDICGSFSHLSSECSLSMRGSYGVGIGSNGKSIKQMDDADLYVGYLPQMVDDNQLKELFSPFGKIVQARVIKDRTTDLSKGYGFVRFENLEDANAAVLHMNGYKMDGKLLAVRVAGQKPMPGPSHFGNLPIQSVPPAVGPNISGQTSSFFAPPVLVFQEAQASISNNQSSYFPSAFVHSGHYNNLSRTEFSSIPPSSQSNIDDSRMAGSFSSTSEFPSQITSSSSAPNLLLQFPGASISNNQSMYFPSSSVQFGLYNNVGRPEILSIPPSSESKTADTRMAGTFSSSSELRSQITNSSLDPNSSSQFPGDPDYRGSQFKSYFSL